MWTMNFNSEENIKSIVSSYLQPVIVTSLYMYNNKIYNERIASCDHSNSKLIINTSKYSSV